jgi:hypothetical protein
MINYDKERNEFFLDFIGQNSTEVSHNFSSYNFIEEIFEKKSDDFPKNPALQQIHMNSSGTMYIFDNDSWQEIEDIKIFE